MHPRPAPHQAPEPSPEVPATWSIFRRPDPEPDPSRRPLTPRQRSIIRAYFAMGCKTLSAARALGVSSRRVREVKALPGAVEYLAAIEEESLKALVQARAAQILAPMLKL